jgi:hypothetical protein
MAPSALNDSISAMAAMLANRPLGVIGRGA